MSDATCCTHLLTGNSDGVGHLPSPHSEADEDTLSMNQAACLVTMLPDYYAVQASI